mmetsp:Transcript_12422/g.1859  ORF Transcript_12422/g.1859 Transcript_12422/m.1859 type:complete len:111 (+) Transcript_12422:540-872(+)
MAGGMYNRPYLPEFEGLKKFKGKFMHSSEFKDAEESVKGKKVVVIGSSKSAIDIVYKCHEYKADKIYWVKRGSSHIFSKRTPGIIGEFNYFRMFYTRMLSSFNLFPDEHC